MSDGPLSGVRVIEMAGIGPAPFCGMLLADMGADVLRIDRVVPAGLGLPVAPRFDVTSRGRRSVALDLKTPAAAAAVQDLARKADILIEGLRPGVMERLGLGPDALLAVNPRLVIGRITGWGQTGPLAATAGHDINYLGITGALGAIGDGVRPHVPLNLVGDYGGGAAYLAIGVLAALHAARQSGLGQVVDAAITDGAASLMSMFYGHLAAGHWQDERGVNSLDGGAPWYGVYRTLDDKFMTVGAIEPKFFEDFASRIGLEPSDWPTPHDPRCWPLLRDRIEEQLATRTRAEWTARLQDSDACTSPVLSLREAPLHPHNQARGTFVDIDGVMQPAPAPRFSRTPGSISRGAPAIGDGGLAALRDWEFDPAAIERLRDQGMRWTAD